MYIYIYSLFAFDTSWGSPVFQYVSGRVFGAPGDFRRFDEGTREHGGRGDQASQKTDGDTRVKCLGQSYPEEQFS